MITGSNETHALLHAFTPVFPQIFHIILFFVLFCFYKKKDLPFSSKSALSVSQFKCTSKVGHLFLQFHKFYNSICLVNSCKNPPTCYCNRRFPSCISPLFQSKSSCKAFHMEISFIHTQISVQLHVNKTNFHVKGFVLGLTLKQR